MNKGPGSMNRIYRLVWRDSLGAYVAVAEFAKGCGKKSSGVLGAVLATALLGATAPAAAAPPAPGALPTGGTVAAGQALISQNGSRLDIQQTTSRAAINWATFNIGSQAQVNFYQPGASSVALNRVQSADPSAIFGRLTANGQVILVNPNGIVFGAGSQVDVGGLVASTLNLSDADFMAGRLRFTRDGATGGILNQGRITAADGGYAALLAPEVRNEGVIAARLGTVALAAGDAMALDISGSGLLNVRVDPATVDALVENRNLVKADGGQVILSAGAANRLIGQAIASHDTASSQLVVDNGRVRLVSAAGAIAAAGGSVKLEGTLVDAAGKADVGGAQAGRIDIKADFLSQSGELRADASQGTGGTVKVDAGTVIQTAGAALSADGAQGGGTIDLKGAGLGRLDADGHGRIYSSAAISARGTAAGAGGGNIRISADSVQLRAATVDASGAAGGGQVLVGGGFRGSDGSIANAVETGVNGATVLRADALDRGDGGQVAVWSDGRTVFGGQILARGGSQGGDGGEAEVSGKAGLAFGGRVDLSAPRGSSGHLALDPHDIVIDDQSSAIVSLDLDDPNPDTVSHANQFGRTVNVLANGNVVVTAPKTSFGGIVQAGAAYLFNSRNGALLGQLYGTHAQDQVGSAGVKILANDNYLVLSPLWNPNGGSATYYSANSLSSYSFTKTTGTGATAGAITWQNGTPAGTAGATSVAASAATYVGSGNSLVGSNATNDRIGDAGTTTITVLSDGNLAVSSPMWNAGRGAVTWMSAATGQLGDNSAGGAVSSANSLVGSIGLRDAAIVETSNAGNRYYIRGQDNAGPTSVWAYNDPNNPNAGTYQYDPLTIGAGDLVGQKVVALANGAFAVVSPHWTNGSAAYAGAVTWGGAGNRTGQVSTGNSLVGTHAYDFVGSGGITPVGTPATGGAPAPNFLVSSPYWKSDANSSGKFLANTGTQGAVTWVNGATGAANTQSGPGAAVSSANSLVGNGGDLIGALDTYTGSYTNTSTRYGSNYESLRTQASGSGLQVLSNGNALVHSNNWSGSKGSVTLIDGDTGTFGDGSTAATGTVSAANSLVGSNGGDSVGSAAILELSDHNVVVSSTDWGGGKGAVTLLSGTNGQIFGEANGVYGAAVSASNSLVGATTRDRVASDGVYGVGSQDPVTQLWSNYLVLSPYWGDTDGTDGRGAVTWGGSTGVQGLIGAANSLVGSSGGDYVGSYAISKSRDSDANYNGSGNFDGVYTFSNSPWVTSLSRAVDILPNGNYVVRSPGWNSGRGAATWGSGTGGVAGTISAANSLVGTTADAYSITTATNTHADGRSYDDTTYALTTVGDHVGLLGKALPNGAYVVGSPFWSGGRGAVTWIAAAGSNAAGSVSGSNSLVGTHPDVYSTTPLAGTAGGDLSLGGGTASLLPIYGVTLGDHLGVTLENATYVNPVESKLHGNNDVGTTTTLPLAPFLLTFYYGKAYQTVGSYPNSTSSLSGYNGYYGYLPALNVQAVGTDGGFVVGSPGWNYSGSTSAAQAGAVTYGSAAGGLPTGTLSAANSLVGTHDYDRIGRNLAVNTGGSASTSSTYVTALTNSNFVIIAPGWNNTSTASSYVPGTGLGAVSFGSAAGGIAGEISAANSLVGAQAGDNVGSRGVSALSDGSYAVDSPNWANGAAPRAGAVSWGSGTTGSAGAVSATNSLVGSAASDQVGSSGITVLPGGAYVVVSPNWDNGTVMNAGAVTYGPAGGVAGAVGQANSLVGATANDQVGSSGIQLLTDRTNSYTNFLVRSPNWTDTATGVARVGAVTWVNGATGYVYGAAGSGDRGTALSAFNSLVGNNANDRVGNAAATALTVTVGGETFNTGDGMIVSSSARTGDVYGAVTLVPGDAGVAGRVSWRNSLLGFNDATTRNTGPLSYTVLPYATTLYEVMNYRPLVWTTVSANGMYSDNSKLMALSMVSEQAAAAIDGAVGHDASSTSAGDGAAWTSSGGFLNSEQKLRTYGYTGDSVSGILPFSATGNGDNAVITPAALAGLLDAGTNVTLQANNDITVLKPVTVSAAGHGGSLTLEAGRSIKLFADITTDNGNFTALANQSSANGVISASADSSNASTAQLFMAPGTSINAGTGNVRLELLGSTDKSKPIPSYTRTYDSTAGLFTVAFSTQQLAANSSSDIVLGNLTGTDILVDNHGGANATTGNVLANAAPSVSFRKAGAADGDITFRAWRDVVLGRGSSGQAVLFDLAGGASGLFSLTLNSAGSGNNAGAISLDNLTASTHGGDISLGGGLADGGGRPTGMAYANASGNNSFTRNYGVSLTGASSLDAGAGNVAIAGKTAASAGSGVYIAGTDAQPPVTVAGASVTLTGERGSGGSGGAIHLANATLGDAAGTSAVNLYGSGFDGAGNGTVAVNSGVALVGKSGSTLTVASDLAASAAQIGGISNGNAGSFWLADSGNGTGGKLGALLASASGFRQVVLGRADQTGATSLQGVDLASWSAGTPLAFDLAVQGGAGGLTVSGTNSGGLANGHRLALATANGGSLNLGTSTIGADLLELQAGASGAVSQGTSGVLQAASLLVNAGGATVDLDGTGNAIGTVAGSLAGGRISDGQSLTVGSVLGSDGLASTGSLLVRALGAASDVALNQALSSQQGDVTVTAGRYFLNNVPLDQGLLAGAGQYWVYSQAPTTLSDGVTSARGMDNFSKHYGTSYTGTTPAFAASGNWFLYSTTPTLTVSAALDATMTYGSATPASPLSYAGFIDGDSLGSAGMSGSAAVGIDGYTASGAGYRPAGSYGISLTGIGSLQSSLGYALSAQAGSGALTVQPKAIAATGSRMYDATQAVDGASLALAAGGVLSGDDVSLASGTVGTVGDKNAGSGKAVAFGGSPLAGTDAGNYQLSGTLDITRRTVTVTASDKSKTYGDPDPALSFVVGGNGLAAGDSLATVFSGHLATATGAAATAGSHAIRRGTLAASDANYSLSAFNDGTLTVSKAALTVTADDQAKVYGDADPALTASYAGFKYGDDAGVVSGLALATATGAAATAGTHAITAAGATAANYAITQLPGTLTVAKAALTVTADDQAKVYGDADPALTASYAGFKYGDDAGAVSGLTLATATGAAATAGTHAITATGATAANYAITQLPGTLTVAKAALTVTADDQAKVYGDADPALTASYAGFKYGDDAGVVSGLALATATGAAATAGTHAITASGATAANYEITQLPGTLTVAKAPLTVTADDQAKVYGDADPALTASYAGFKYGDDAGAVSGLALATATGAAATAGTHAITATGATAANYDITQRPGTLTVAKAALTVTADDQAKVYGDADPALTASYAGFKYGDDAGVVNGLALATATGAAATAGTHAITATGATAANYDITQRPGTLTVAKAALTVTADDQAKVYGDADPALTASYAGFKYADDAGVVSGLALATATGAAATAGTHAITATGATAANYAISQLPGTLTVAKAALTVTADDQAKVYGDADPALTASYAGFKYADDAGAVSGLTLATATGAAATAGTHAVTASGATAANYAIAQRPGTLTVAKAALTVTADDQAKVYGDADPALTASYAGFKYADDAGAVSGLTLATATGAAATAGTHAITASGATAANYAISQLPGTLTVAKAPLTVTADDQAKLTGESDPLLTYTVNRDQLRYADASDVVSDINLATRTGPALIPGDYPIVASGGRAQNYLLTLLDGTFTVKPSPSVRAENLVTTVSTSPAAASPAPAAPVVQGQAETAATQPGSLSVVGGGLSFSAGGQPASSPTPAQDPAAAASSQSGANPGSENPAASDRGQVISVRPEMTVGTAAGATVSVSMAAAFQHDSEAPLTFSAALAGGEPLPSWLRVDGRTGEISGQPPAGFSGTVKVLVTARNSDGQAASTEVKIAIGASR